MRSVFESTVAQLNAALQRMGANVGLELLAWPGGYFMAASVWLYKGAAVLARYRLVQRPKESRR
jgi:hypothetical protein